MAELSLNCCTHDHINGFYQSLKVKGYNLFPSIALNIKTLQAGLASQLTCTELSPFSGTLFPLTSSVRWKIKDANWAEKWMSADDSQCSHQSGSQTVLLVQQTRKHYANDTSTKLVLRFKTLEGNNNRRQKKQPNSKTVQCI